MPEKDFLHLEDGLRILKHNCKNTLEQSRDPISELSFKDPFEAVVFAAYTGSLIPLNESWGLNIQEVGGAKAGDVPEQLWRNVAVVDLTIRPWLHIGWDYNLRDLLQNFKDYLNRPKHIILAEQNSVEETIASIKKEGLQPEDYVIYSTEGGVLAEPFYNYLAICYFRSKGYLTGMWSPSPEAGVFSSDLIAVKIPEYQEALVHSGFLHGAGGATILELEAIPAVSISDKSQANAPKKYDMVYIEVEDMKGKATSTSDENGIGQQAHLLSPHSEVYGVGPDSDISAYRKSRFSDRFRNLTVHSGRVGAILFDKGGRKLVCRPKKEGFSLSKTDETDETIESYKYMLNLLFFSKLPLMKALKLAEAKSISEFVTKAAETPFEMILESLKNP